MYKSLLIVLLALIPLSTSAYPGCSPDIIIGGQIWSSCNSISKGKGSTARSGWYYAGDANPLYSSANRSSDWIEERRTRSIDRVTGTCAKGYRIPTRGDWETALWYARLNGTDVSRLLRLEQNGVASLSRIDGEITPIREEGILGAYWSSTVDDFGGTTPIILRLRSPVFSYRLDSTDPSGVDADLTRYDGLEVANVRCIRR